MIVNNLLPNWVYLLDEADPVALYALKLLSFITNKSRVYSEICDKMGIYSMIVPYYSSGHKRLNSHTMKILKDMIETPSLPFSTIVHQKLIENTL